MDRGRGGFTLVETLVALALTGLVAGWIAHIAVETGAVSRLGVRLEIAPGWHIYGAEVGDVGLPTQLDWAVDGGSVGAIDWPCSLRLAREAEASPAPHGTAVHRGRASTALDDERNPPRRAGGGAVRRWWRRP